MFGSNVATSQILSTWNTWKNMVDFRRWQCRNCKHWHVMDFETMTQTAMCRYHTETDILYCMCDNWQSSDNLKYLEDLHAKRSAKNQEGA